MLLLWVVLALLMKLELPTAPDELSRLGWPMRELPCALGLRKFGGGGNENGRLKPPLVIAAWSASMPDLLPSSSGSFCWFRCKGFTLTHRVRKTGDKVCIEKIIIKCF